MGIVGMLQLPVMLVIISSLFGSFFPFAGLPLAAPPAIDVTGHVGEQTAAFLSSDTDVYLTVNLDPTDNQLSEFWKIVNEFWQDPNLQAKWDEGMAASDNASALNIEEDVFPWLGPEVAMGLRNVIPETDPSEAANYEMYEAEAAIEECMAEAGVYQLDAAAGSWDGSSGHVTCTVAGGESEDAQAELMQVKIAIQACMAEAMVSQLDAGVPGWDGSPGQVTAGGGVYDASVYLGHSALKATYDVAQDGDVMEGHNVSWQGVGWDAGTSTWITTGSTKYDAANYLGGTTFKATYDVAQNGNITAGHNVSWTGVQWDSSSVGWKATSAVEQTEMVLFLGTMDKTASDACFEKFKAWYSEEFDLTFTTTEYRGVTIVDTGPDEEFFAFTDQYIVYTPGPGTIHSTIDLMLDGGTSLADTANFKAAQASLRADRLGMVFANYAHVLDEVARLGAPAELSGELDLGITLGKEYFPAYYAAAVYCTDDGIALAASYPLPESGYVTTASGPDLLRSATLVPGDALAFRSRQDVNATWGKVCSEIEDSWDNITQFITQSVLKEGDTLPDLLPGTTMSDFDSLSSLLTWLKNNYEMDVNTDLLGWMIGESSVALLPIAFNEDSSMKTADMLVMFEVSDPVAVDASLDRLFDGVEKIAKKIELTSVQSAVTQMMQDNGLTTIQGVQAPTNNMGAFPDTTTTHGVAGVGWAVYHCDTDGDGTYETSYFGDKPTTWSYTCDNNGTVSQAAGGPDFGWATVSIGGVEAKTLPASLWEDKGESAAEKPGWLFLDAGSTHYLVIGTTPDALIAAVNASQGKVASLDESESYKGVLSQLPETKMSLSYFDLAAWSRSMVVSRQMDELYRVQQAVTTMMQKNGLSTIQGVQTPTNNMGAFPDTATAHGTAGKGWTIYQCDRNGDGKYGSGSAPYDKMYYWDNETQWSYTCDNQGKVTQHIDEGNADVLLGVGSIPLKAALGATYVLGPNNTVAVFGALYLQPPPLVDKKIPVGTSTVNIAEQVFDLTKLDASIGKCSVKIDVDIKDAPDGAGIQVTALDELTEEIGSAFALVATNGSASVADVAYGIRVDKTGLTSSNIGSATITMKVGRAWADAYHTENVKVFRMSDGVQEALPTTFVGYDGDYAVFQAVSAGGLSTFGLVAVLPLSTALSVSDLTVDPARTKTGRTVSISVKAANSSIAGGTYKVVLKMNGEEVDSQSIWLAGGGSDTVTFEVTAGKAGTYDVEVNGVTATLRVPEPTNWALIGGLIGAGVLALGVVGIVLARRRHSEGPPAA